MCLVFHGYNLVRGSVFPTINKKVNFQIPPTVELLIWWKSQSNLIPVYSSTNCKSELLRGSKPLGWLSHHWSPFISHGESDRNNIKWFSTFTYVSLEFGSRDRNYSVLLSRLDMDSNGLWFSETYSLLMDLRIRTYRNNLFIWAKTGAVLFFLFKILYPDNKNALDICLLARTYRTNNISSIVNYMFLW